MPEERPFIFKENTTELILPVPLGSYSIDHGVNIEVVNIHELGDVIVSGYGTLATIQIECMLPANEYPFATSSDPEPFLQQFKAWEDDKAIVRFIIGGTGVNIPVKIQNIQHGEQDGTNDVYATLTLREYREPLAVQMTNQLIDGLQRTGQESGSNEVLTHNPGQGDTLASLSYKHYGTSDKTVYQALAEYNNITNPNAYPLSDVIKLPKQLLQGENKCKYLSRASKGYGIYRG